MLIVLVLVTTLNAPLVTDGAAAVLSLRVHPLLQTVRGYNWSMHVPTCPNPGLTVPDQYQTGSRHQPSHPAHAWFVHTVLPAFHPLFHLTSSIKLFGALYALVDLLY